MKLSDLQDSVEKKNPSLSIEIDDETTVVLRPLLRCSKQDRDEAVELIKLIIPEDDEESEGEEPDKDSKDEDYDPEEVEKQEKALRELIYRVAYPKAAGEKLLESIGDDIALLMEVFTEYMGETDLGEASNSSDS